MILKFSIMTSSAGRDVITGRWPGLFDLKLTFSKQVCTNTSSQNVFKPSMPPKLPVLISTHIRHIFDTCPQFVHNFSDSWTPTSWLVQGWYWYNFCPTRIVVSAQLARDGAHGKLSTLPRTYSSNGIAASRERIETMNSEMWLFGGALNGG